MEETFMAKTVNDDQSSSVAPKFSTRAYTRCRICGQSAFCPKKVRHLPCYASVSWLTRVRCPRRKESFLVRVRVRR